MPIEIITPQFIQTLDIGPVSSPHARDVAEHILTQLGEMDARKLQKLLYYCQAWSVVWDGHSMFPEELRAWKSGPVCREVWKLNEYQPTVKFVGGDPRKLSGTAKETADAVIRFYGRMTATSLVALTHRETPWRRARGGLPADALSDAVISATDMREYFARIATGPGKELPEALMRGIDLLLSIPSSELPLWETSSECSEDYIPRT